jgi:hypothetical protein
MEAAVAREREREEREGQKMDGAGGVGASPDQAIGLAGARARGGKKTKAAR